MFRYPAAQGIELQLMEERHAEAVFALTEKHRTYLAEWLPWVKHTNHVEDIRTFIRSELQRFASNNGMYMGIYYEGVLVGSIGLHHIDWSNRHSSIGYWLAESHQGRGIMTAACRGMTTYAFQELGLNRMEIRACTENAKSRAIPERLGFKQEGVVREAEFNHDRFWDHVVYGMLAREWG